jgi:hypothetical protein
VTLARPVADLSEAGGRSLGEAYWIALRRASGGLLRCRATRAGVEVRVLGVGPALLAFGPPAIRVSGDAVVSRYPIRGGLLARAPGGDLALCHAGLARPALTTAVHGFLPSLGLRPGLPRWTGALYEVLQRRAHVAISRRYFRMLADGGRR